MKKPILLAFAILAVAALSGCAHPHDLLDDLASAPVPAAAQG
jgi:hypothetical protein